MEGFPPVAEDRVSFSNTHKVEVDFSRIRMNSLDSDVDEIVT